MDDEERGADGLKALLMWASEMLRSSMLRRGALPIMPPDVVRSYNALVSLSVFKALVESKKKDRVISCP